MWNIEERPKLAELSAESRENLSKVHDYALDYNIFLLKGIKQKIDDNDEGLIVSVTALFDSIPKEYSQMMYNPLAADCARFNEPSTTSMLQFRVLDLLIQERHRRDIDVLNAKFENKIKYEPLSNPWKYEIKSPYYRAFAEANEEFADQFVKFALLQSLEYDFEHSLDDENDYQSDDDLIAHFCDDELMEFTLKGSETDEITVNQSEIVRVILPLASQAILSNDESDKES